VDRRARAVRRQTTAVPPWHPLAWADALATFGRTETAGGVVLLVALAGALAWANVASHSYVSTWSHELVRAAQPVPSAVHSVSGLIDNGLMTVFFLAVGLEIGREVAEGSLRDRRNALLPVLAALGGMAGAAVIYLIAIAILHPHVHASRGWGVPMATDVAFVLGAIALLGRRVPRSLRIFVLALAVADDIVSVVILAMVASTRIHVAWLVAAAAALAAVCLLRRRVRHGWWPYVVAALVTWYLFARAGIEPTLAGAFVGLLIPVAGGARAGRALEAPVHALSSYAILPLFVVANAGVVLTGSVWHATGAVPVMSAIIAARVVGKMLGITLAVLLLVRLRVCGLPEGTTWRHIVGVSLLCGMGITVPLLFAHALFGGNPALFSGTQIGLLLGTLGAAVLGGAVLLGAPRPANPHLMTAPDRQLPDDEPTHRAPVDHHSAADQTKEAEPQCEPD
jgi:NhaA family Na+:H+ antiporter